MFLFVVCILTCMSEVFGLQFSADHFVLHVYCCCPFVSRCANLILTCLQTICCCMRIVALCLFVLLFLEFVCSVWLSESDNHCGHTKIACIGLGNLICGGGGATAADTVEANGLVEGSSVAVVVVLFWDPRGC